MRNFGMILLLSGILGFAYASSRLGDLEPLPSGLTLSETLGQTAGRWTMVRYGCGGVAMVGLLLALFPKGR